MRAASVLVATAVIGALAVAALIGAHLPLRLLTMAAEGGLTPLVAGVFAFIGVAAGAFIAFFAITIGVPLLIELLSSEGRAAREAKLTAYRARQRAMLEELDEVRRLLEEIRDLLKRGVEG